MAVIYDTSLDLRVYCPDRYRQICILCFTEKGKGFTISDCRLHFWSCRVCKIQKSWTESELEDQLSAETLEKIIVEL